MKVTHLVFSGNINSIFKNRAYTVAIIKLIREHQHSKKKKIVIKQ